jgi:endoglucanase
MVLVLAASMVLRLADWTLKVVVYEPAVLSPATGTTAAFTIPVRFNGDTVRTMAGYYPDGTYSAPDDWTAYKQYGYVFDPEEATGTIKMQTNLQGVLREGPVVLAFTFDSGTTVTYTLTRTGDHITGTPGGELPTG